MRTFYCHCRFCKKFERDENKVVKYGVRHWAHFRCYLVNDKRLEDLPEWQVGRFPALLLKEHDLVEVALAIIGGKRGEKLIAQKLQYLKETSR